MAFYNDTSWGWIRGGVDKLTLSCWSTCLWLLHQQVSSLYYGTGQNGSLSNNVHKKFFEVRLYCLSFFTNRHKWFTIELYKIWFLATVWNVSYWRVHVPFLSPIVVFSLFTTGGGGGGYPHPGQGGYPPAKVGTPHHQGRYPPPPTKDLLHGGRYASCVHAGGLSCFYIF